jgi:DNA-binding MarR family transcriptional regulator
MGASDSTGQLGAALFGKSKRTLLALFYVQPERSFYLRQITRTLGIGQGAAQQELARLVEAGPLVRTRVDRRANLRSSDGPEPPSPSGSKPNE